MANNDITLLDQSTPPVPFKPDVLDAGNGVRRSRFSVANAVGTTINPATEESMGVEGANSPTIPGTGIRGWLRSQYDALGVIASNINNVVTGLTTVNTTLTSVINATLTTINNTLAAGLKTFRPPITYTKANNSPFTLTSAWQLVATTTSATRGLRIAPVVSASTYDIEWVSVTAGSSAPTDSVGEPVLGGEDFVAGVPIGDIYLKSASGQTAIVKTGI